MDGHGDQRRCAACRRDGRSEARGVTLGSTGFTGLRHVRCARVPAVHRRATDEGDTMPPDVHHGRSPGLSSGHASTEVLDARGAVAPGARYQGGNQLDVSGLSGGLYLLRASDGTRTYVQRFNKQ